MCPSPVAGQAEGLREADTGAHQQTERSRERKEQLRAQMRGDGEGMGDPPLIPMHPHGSEAAAQAQDWLYQWVKLYNVSALKSS